MKTNSYCHLGFAVIALLLVGDAVTQAAPVISIDYATNARDGGTIDLTSTGTIDWFQYGDSSGVIQKSSTGLAGGPAVDRIQIIAQSGSFSDTEEQYFEATSWTDGTPTQSGTGIDEGRLIGSGNGTWTFRIDDIQLISGGAFNFYTYSRDYNLNLTATVFDSVTNLSLGDATRLNDGGGVSINQFYTINFAADSLVSNAQYLLVTASTNGTAGSLGFDRFGINAAALSGTVIPEPSTYALVGLGLGALWFLRRRRGSPQ
ncbi:MAG: PEP-CTERM sorting domain-containing protein [Blastochloris sp.]|nr:PEP-CTERM sorting domain-containing protein [Blastochloris sp.]